MWVYGKDDDTLFRLIALGTGSLSPGDAFKKQGFVRKGSENVVAPMPPYGAIIKTDDEIWKIITWIRSVDCERQRGGAEGNWPAASRSSAEQYAYLFKVKNISVPGTAPHTKFTGELLLPRSKRTQR